MAKKPKIRKVFVVMERYTEMSDYQMLLRVSGGGISYNETDYLWGLLTDIDGVDNAIVTRSYVAVERDYGDKVDWSTIVPAVKKVLVKFFGRGVRITERMRPSMDEYIGMMLGEAAADDFRDTFRGCALTEDECDAFGIDFHQHNNELRGVDY
ncbi:MAG: NifU N-terminal domain-containing protein [Candidatus Yanofskybacteria bacterium]|nr:NifU N-terminal domain-containing protein [Candidatus Yanofskybacteria bacterium]